MKRSYNKLDRIASQKRKEWLRKIKYKDLIKKEGDNSKIGIYKDQKNDITDCDSFSKLPLGISLGNNSIDHDNGQLDKVTSLENKIDNRHQNSLETKPLLENDENFKLNNKRLHKPDPFAKQKLQYKANRSNLVSTQELNEKAEAEQMRKTYYARRKQKTLTLRKKTSKGQPIMKNLIKNCLEKILESEQCSKDHPR